MYRVSKHCTWSSQLCLNNKSSSLTFWSGSILDYIHLCLKCCVNFIDDCTWMTIFVWFSRSRWSSPLYNEMWRQDFDGSAIGELKSISGPWRGGCWPQPILHPEILALKVKPLLVRQKLQLCWVVLFLALVYSKFAETQQGPFWIFRSSYKIIFGIKWITVACYLLWLITIHR